jgi:hypothetical protein
LIQSDATLHRSNSIDEKYRMSSGSDDNNIEEESDDSIVLRQKMINRHQHWIASFDDKELISIAVGDDFYDSGYQVSIYQF